MGPWIQSRGPQAAGGTIHHGHFWRVLGVSFCLQSLQATSWAGLVLSTPACLRPIEATLMALCVWTMAVCPWLSVGTCPLVPLTVGAKGASPGLGGCWQGPGALYNHPPPGNAGLYPFPLLYHIFNSYHMAELPAHPGKGRVPAGNCSCQVLILPGLTGFLPRDIPWSPCFFPSHPLEFLC